MSKPKYRRRPAGRRSSRAASTVSKPAPEPQTGQATPPGEADAKKASTGLDPKSHSIVMALMVAMLVLFLAIALFAPDPTSPHGKAGVGTILWRLLFLLVPLGIMYGLLWGEKALKLIRR